MLHKERAIGLILDGRNDEQSCWGTVLSCLEDYMSHSPLDFDATQHGVDLAIIVQADDAATMSAIRRSLEQDSLFRKYSKPPYFLSGEDLELAYQRARYIGRVQEGRFEWGSRHDSALAQMAFFGLYGRMA